MEHSIDFDDAVLSTMVAFNGDESLGAKTGLLIVNDEETIYQFLIASKDFENVHWKYAISNEYNSYNSYIRVLNMCRKCSKLKERFSTFITAKNPVKEHFDYLMLVPGYGKDTEEVIGTKFNWEQLVLLDKGLNDHIKNNFKHLDLDREAIKYTFNKSSLANDNYKDIRELIPTKSDIESFESLFGDSLKVFDVLRSCDVVIFSSSTIYDLDEEIHEKMNKFIHNTYSNRKIAVKRHPRDYTCYGADDVVVKYVPDNFTNELVISELDIPEIWVYPSSLFKSASEKYNRDIYLLYFKHIEDDKYINLIENARKSGFNIIELD